MRKVKKWLWATALGLVASHSNATPVELDQVEQSYGQIAEDQVFILRFNQPVKAQEIITNSYCVSSAVGEQIPLRALGQEQTLELLENQSYSYSKEQADRYVVTQCAQRLAPSSTLRVELLDAKKQNLVPRAFTEDATGLSFEVRGPLRVQLVCEKTKSTADCNPLLPFKLRFSAPVSAEKLTQIQLKKPSGDGVPIQPSDDDGAFIDELSFDAPMVALAELQWQLPTDWDQLQDDAGRQLSNADFFQRPVKMAAFPPLLKFANEQFGVVERFADEPASTSTTVALLPLALRGIEPELLKPRQKQSAGQLRTLRVDTAQEMLYWYARLARVGDYSITQQQLEAGWYLQDYNYNNDSPQVDPKTRSLFDFLQMGDQTQTLTLPGVPDSKDKSVELIGVPLKGTGLHILEAKSERLGQTYTDPDSAMYVRSAALVTNVAVHSKISADQIMVWVSRLDTAQPIENALVEVLDCNGRTLISERTDAQGRLVVGGIQTERSYCSTTGLSSLFIAASIDENHPDAYGKKDISFVLSDWDKGLESWRFQLPYYYGSDDTNVVHTVVDRPLFLAGETVHLKHYWRDEADFNLNRAIPELVLRHSGSGDEITQPLQWRKNPSGGWYALSTITLAKNATLGSYEVSLQGKKHHFESASFRVEAFKLPYLTGQLGLSPKNASQQSALVAVDEALLDIQLNYISGGVAADQAVQISALTQPASPRFSAYDDYSFTPEGDFSRPITVVDKAALTLNAEGAGQMDFALNPSPQVLDLVVEASFMDPNGQVQSLSQRQKIWPADVVVGVNHPYWETGDTIQVKGVTIDPTGQPLANQTVQIEGVKQTYLTTRQRMVGGFYRYDSQEKTEPIGTLCTTKSNEKGEWQCQITHKESGQLLLRSSSIDAKKRTYTTVSSLWLGGESASISGDNHDRMDVLAEQKTAKPGDTVRFQVSMPFSSATALVSVEQDRILQTQVVHLTNDNPFFDLNVEKEWGPNVYVSVLALRGRIYETTWRDFFSGGWKTPFEWYQKYTNSDEALPSTMIDLAKPSFRYGIAQLKIENTAHQLAVELTPEKQVYGVGQTARLQVKATQPDGTPAANASLLLVGVDQALLELVANESWNLLEAMYPTVGYNVRTATMQSEIIGRRHYGRKAVPAGGGGGGAPTREILDSLLVWRTDVVLDENGQAVIDVPLNHSLTQFELVALVDSGGNKFGSAHAQIQTHQPIQIMSGLPAEVRSGDQYEAVFTVRNRDKAALDIDLKVNGFINDQLVFDFPVQTQTVPAQSNAAFRQSIKMPTQLGANEGLIRWQLTALDQQTQDVMDSLQFEQQWQALVPERIQQVTWKHLQPGQTQLADFSVPATALKDKGLYLGGVQLNLQPSLGGQQTIRDWFQDYKYTCFEQQASKYIALHDVASWQGLMQELPTYLDNQNLLRYFPSSYLTGSAGLNAYVLSLSAHNPDELALPQPIAQKLLDGLKNYIEGRRNQPSTDAKQQVAFYMAAVDALARYDLARPEMLDSISMAPTSWPTSALVDGLHILQNPLFNRTQHAELLLAIETELSERLVQRGAALLFTDDNVLNHMSALMVSPTTNQARLILTVADLPQWADRIPSLMHGLLAQQYRGRWGTTTENSWVLLALEQVDQSEVLHGVTQVQLGTAPVKDILWTRKTTTPVSHQWTWEQNAPVSVNNRTDAGLWMQLQSRAAVPVTEARMEGYRVERTVTPVQQATAGQWHVGDMYRVDLTIHAEHSSDWAVISDAVPAGASILGSGLGRDSEIALAEQSTTSEDIYPSYVERLYSGYRAYVEYLPAGTSRISYRVRLNTAGQFALSPTEVEALYDASIQAQLPLEAMTVHAAQ